MGNESSQAVAEELQPAYSAPPRKRRESAIENLQKRVSRYENGLAEQEHEHEHGQESKQKEKQKQRDLQVSGPREDAERQDLPQFNAAEVIDSDDEDLLFEISGEAARNTDSDGESLVDSEEDADQGRTFLRMASAIDFNSALPDDQWHVNPTTNLMMKSKGIIHSCIRATIISQWRFFADESSRREISKAFSMSFQAFKASKAHRILARSCYGRSRLKNAESREMFSFAKYLAKYMSGEGDTRERLSVIFHELDLNEDGKISRSDLLRNGTFINEVLELEKGSIANFILDSIDMRDQVQQRIEHMKAVEAITSCINQSKQRLEADTLYIMHCLRSDPETGYPDPSKDGITEEEFITKLLGHPSLLAMLDPVKCSHMLLRSFKSDVEGAQAHHERLQEALASVADGVDAMRGGHHLR